MFGRNFWIKCWCIRVEDNFSMLGVEVATTGVFWKMASSTCAINFLALCWRMVDAWGDQVWR